MGEDQGDRVDRSLFGHRTVAGVVGRGSTAPPSITVLDSIVVIGEVQ